MASLCAPLAIKETFAPALLRQHPRYPPIAPAPKIQILIIECSYSKPNFLASPILWSFPVAPLGISSKKQIYLGTLKLASSLRA